jgi:hypothetical protein
MRSFDFSLVRFQTGFANLERSISAKGGSSTFSRYYSCAAEARKLLGVRYPMPEMKVMAARPGVVSSTTSQIAAWPVGVALVFFGLLWLEVINQLKG